MPFSSASTGASFLTFLIPIPSYLGYKNSSRDVQQRGCDELRALPCNGCCTGKSDVPGAKEASRRIASAAEHEGKCINSRTRDIEVRSV